MNLVFTVRETDMVKFKLRQADLPDTEHNVGQVLIGVDAAFQQQFDEEADHIINELFP